MFDVQQLGEKEWKQTQEFGGDSASRMACIARPRRGRPEAACSPRVGYLGPRICLFSRGNRVRYHRAPPDKYVGCVAAPSAADRSVAGLRTSRRARSEPLLLPGRDRRRPGKPSIHRGQINTLDRHLVKVYLDFSHN